LNFFTSPKPFSLRLSFNGMYLKTDIILLLMSSISQKSTKRQCLITSETPLCLDIMTGTLLLIASKGVIPKGSDTDGMT